MSWPWFSSPLIPAGGLWAKVACRDFSHFFFLDIKKKKKLHFRCIRNKMWFVGTSSMARRLSSFDLLHLA